MFNVAFSYRLNRFRTQSVDERPKARHIRCSRIGANALTDKPIIDCPLQCQVARSDVRLLGQAAGHFGVERDGVLHRLETPLELKAFAVRPRTVNPDFVPLAIPLCLLGSHTPEVVAYGEFVNGFA
ncbi:hypothetical protein [Mycobacteroides abscessus]|uniref:hypothetical protein n=1 Tax=Mycobacteroides abscessus TaxID=36809 RepID=UPI00266F1CCE|nr:hypothetical protein [Mycobacteroides abscessus]MDO3107376.1 hypothetical protein [Mycobacteroides abscessus subsp. abscessus]